jgi:hypothetical protein
MEQYLSSLETIAAETAREFSGQNSVRVFPRLKAIEVQKGRIQEDLKARQALRSARKRIKAMEASRSWRMTEPLRRIISRLKTRKPARAELITP